MSLDIRPLTLADLDEVVRLNNAAVPAVPRTSGEEIAALLDAADHAYAVDEPGAGGGLAAFLIGFDPGSDYDSENYRWFEARGADALYVDRIVVDASTRGAGIGRMLYERVFREARRAGRDEVVCEVNVRPPNPESLAFHARMGFVEVGRQPTKGGSVEVALLAASVRSRLATWTDPHEGAARIPEMSGLDYVRAMIDGSVPPPPISALMRMTALSAETGEVTFACEPDESHYNPIGTVHGGLVCTLLDSVIGCAVQTTLPAGRGYTSIDISVSYLRAVRADTGTLTAVGRVTKPGSRVAFAEGTVTDAAGRLIATATSSCLVFPLAAAGAPSPG